MSLIEPEGMFGGDRMALLSDTAKLHWPWFWCASNTVGRIELDYHKVMAKAYRQFSVKPTEVEFWSFAAEFKNAFLLYIYEYDGQIWGQWDTSEKNLQRHKLAIDARSPAPTVRDFTEFKNKYLESKKNRSSGKLSIINNFGNISETREEKPTCSTGLRGVGVGVGVGGGEEESKPCASDDARGGVLFPVSPLIPRKGAEPKQPLTAQQISWFAEWWAIYWRTGSKKDAVTAFGKHVKTEERFQQVMIATRLQSAMMLARDESKRPLGATWINGERWDDPTCEARASPSPEQDASLMRVIGNLERMHGKHL